MTCRKSTTTSPFPAKRLPGAKSILLPGHLFRFDALLFQLRTTPGGSTLELDYRIDAEDMYPAIGKLPLKILENVAYAAITEPNSQPVRDVGIRSSTG